MATINSSTITTQIRVSDLKKFSILIIKWFVGISIITVIPPNSKIIVSSITPHLYSEIRASRDLYHFAFKHNWIYLQLFIDFIAWYLNNEFITRLILCNVFISHEIILLSGSKTICAKSSNHNSPIRSPCNCIPWCLRVTPTTRWNDLKSMIDMHVTLSLKTK